MNELKYSLGMMVTFINVGSFFFVIPLSVKWKKGIGYQVQNPAAWRKMVCFFTAFACSISEFFLLLNFIKSQKLGQKLPIQYFNLARRLSAFIFFGIAWLNVNHKSKYFEGFINRIQWNFVLCSSNRNISPMPQIGTKFRWAYCGIFMTLLIVHYFLLCLDSFLRNNRSITAWKNSWIKSFSEQYFLYQLPKSNARDIGSLTLGFFFTFLAINFQFFTQWLPLVASFTLLSVTKKAKAVPETICSNRMCINPATTYEQTLQCHELLKRIFDDYNATFGLVTFGLTVVFIPQLVYFLNELIDPPSLTRFIRNSIRFTHYFIYLLLSARINSMTNILGDWISKSENYNKLSLKKLSILMFEISTGKIGIFAWGLFKITTEAIGSIVTALFTFSIIILQFQNAECANKQ